MADEGIYATFDTACNSTVCSVFWLLNFVSQLADEKRYCFSGLPRPKPFFIERFERTYGGIGGENCAKCLGRIAFLLCIMNAEGKTAHCGDATINCINGKDIGMLFGLDMMRSLRIEWSAVTNRCYMWNKDMTSKVEIPMFQARYSKLPLFKIDSFEAFEKEYDRIKGMTLRQALPQL